VAQVSRVSFGVQSFDPGIQAAIGRIQPVQMIETCMMALRARGVRGINFDLMYGLPTQTIASLDGTLDEVIRLRPNRIALFGYAHLPAMFPRQRRIDSAALPDAKARFEQAAHGYERLVREGYRAIGFDHFALPDDPMAIAAEKGQLRRNFQGFTDDPADTVIGMGASAISMFPHMIVQNEKAAGAYRDLCGQSRLSGVRGIRRCQGDQHRAKIIENLLCCGRARIGTGWPQQVQQALSQYQEMGLVQLAEDEVSIVDEALPYARHVASVFDEKLALAKTY
jgi:oxygen-independent coproporphyrinogen-3 oxidase